MNHFLSARNRECWNGSSDLDDPDENVSHGMGLVDETVRLHVACLCLNQSVGSCCEVKAFLFSFEICYHDLKSISKRPYDRAISGST